MPKFLKIFLNLFLSLLIVLQNLIFYAQPVEAALTECGALGIEIKPDKFFYKDSDEITMTTSLLDDGNALKTTIPSDQFSINTRFNKTLFLGVGFPDQITGTSPSFSFDRDKNVISAPVKMQHSTVFGQPWPIGQYEIRLIKNGSDHCTLKTPIYIAPTQLTEAGNCKFSLPANVKYGKGFTIPDFQINDVSGVVYTPLLFEGIKKDSDFTLANEKDLTYYLARIGTDTAAGAGLGAVAGIGVFSVPGAVIGGGIGLATGLVYNLMNPDQYGPAKTMAERYIIFDKDTTPPKLEIKDDIPVRADGYTLVMAAKLAGFRGPGNQFGTACGVNRFKVTTDPTSAETTDVKVPISANAGGEICGDESSPGISTAIGCIHTQPVEFVKDFMRFAVGISGGLAFLIMLYGAFQMITSSGNPEALKSGQDRLTSAVIGLLMVIFATLLLQIIGVDILKIPGFVR